MKDNKQKLELTWIGKHNSEYNIANIEPRILQENPDLSNCKNDANTQNKIIHGDNLLALKALLPEFEGKVKCIYIDPPYNTGNAFEHYDDAVEHSTWLSLMKPRLELLRLLLSEDGVIFVQIDDNEFAHLYLLLVEIYGERNLKTICVKMSEATGVKMASIKKSGSIPKLKEFIIIAKKNGVKNLNLEKIAKDRWDDEYKYLINNVSRQDLEFLKYVMEEECISDENFSKADDIAKKIRFSSVNDILNGKDKDDWDNIRYENAWRIVRDVAVTGSAKLLADQKRTQVEQGCFLIKTPQSKKYLMKKDYNSSSNQPRCKILFADSYLTISVGDMWTDIKTTGLDNEGGIEFRNGKKPEKLIKRIIDMCTTENDFVLDSFLGSGTTAAVAHKMNRRYIGIEMGDHAYTHCKTRLDKVIAGEQGGISKAVNWQGGGAYKFYELAPSFIAKDEFGNLVIDAFYNDAKLIQAMCKLMNFIYQPSQEQYWKHGISSGKNYLFITTQILTCALVAQISSHLGENESLIICSKNFESGAGKIDSRIAVKKIPQSVLKSCHFGKKEYLLPIKENKALEELTENEVEEEKID